MNYLCLFHIKVFGKNLVESAANDLKNGNVKSKNEEDFYLDKDVPVFMNQFENSRCLTRLNKKDPSKIYLSANNCSIK